MATKPKSNSVIAVTHDAEKGTLTFGAVGAGETVLTLANVSQVVRETALIHGLKQRISDAAALSREVVNGVEINATPANKLAAMAELVEHYNSGTGEWSLKRTGGGRGDSFEVQILIDAIVMAEYVGKDGKTVMREQATEYVKGLKAVERKALAQSPVFKEYVDMLIEERLPKVDTEELIKGL